MNQKGDSTLKMCKQKLNYLNYSRHTVSIYLHYINEFLQAQQKSAVHLNAAHFNSYLLNYRYTSTSQQNQVINAIRFLYKHVLNKKYTKVSFQRPRHEKKLPRIIDQSSILQSIEKIGNLKHKAILLTAFSVGLRVSEVQNLQISDIDSHRMIIHIKNAKGKKDRITPLSHNVLLILRQYYRQYKPVDLLFPGVGGLYSATSLNQLFKKYIDPDGHFHLLRHASLTAMLENGTDLRIIQNIAGHSSSRTTEIYTHVSTKILHTAKLAI